MNYKRSLIILNFCLIFSLVSCGGGSSGPEPVGSLKQKYFFALEYNNGAVNNYNGISINNNGEINYFMLDSPSTEPLNGQITEQYLDTIFNDRKMFLNLVDEGTLSSKNNIIQEASNGQLSEPIVVCFDAGTYLYSAFLFNTVTGVYERVIVYSTGTLQSVNNNPAAIELRDWLVKIAVDNQIAMAGSNCTGDFTGVGGP